MKALLIAVLMTMAGIAQAHCLSHAWSVMQDSDIPKLGNIPESASSLKLRLDSLKSCIGNQSTNILMEKYSDEEIQKRIDYYEAAYAKQKAKEDAEEAAEKAEQARLAKLPGVRIGMSANDVLTKSNWGRPYSVNRTTTAVGTHEQWVYGRGIYLYFNNGKLTAIQN